MRKCALALTVILMSATNVLGGFLVSSSTVSVHATLDRVDLYARNTGGGTGEGLIAVALSVNATSGSVAYFRSTPDGLPNVTNTSRAFQRSFVRIDDADASSSLLIDRSPAGNWPLVPALGTQTVGIEDFAVTVVSFGGPTPASSGAGARFASLYVSKPYVASISGFLGGEVGSKVPFAIVVPPPLPPPWPVVQPPPDTVVQFGNVVSDGAPFSVAVNAFSSDATDVLSLHVGVLPAGVSVTSITGGGMSPQTFIVSGRVDYGLVGTTVWVPFTVSNTNGSSIPAAFKLIVIPEPGALSAGMLLGGFLRRRR